MWRLESRTVTCYVHTKGVNGKSTKTFYTGLHQEEEEKEEERGLFICENKCLNLHEMLKFGNWRPGTLRLLTMQKPYKDNAR